MPSPAVDTVARTAWGEARNQGQIGMQAVMNVVMNRVARQSWYGMNPVSVCLKSSQFSCWDRGDVNRAKLLAVTDDDPQFVEALKLAEMAVAETLPDLTEQATHYFAVSIVPPVWAKSMTFTVQIGDHRFYRAAA